MAESSTLESLTRKPRIQANIKQTEQAVARQVPPQLFLGLALGSMIASAGLAVFARHKETANFVGLWAPSFLLIGIYNKIVHLEENEEALKMRQVA